jgi:hypothetical protein
MATKKKSSSSGKAKAKVGKVMHEYKHGQLKSGKGGKGGKVKNPKQAIAIGLSEARAAGAKIPKKKAASKKKGAPKKGAAKKSTTRKSAAKKKR